MVADTTLLKYVCAELVSELTLQPSSRSKCSLSENEIECAVNSLGWDTSNLIALKPSNSSDGEQLSRSQIHEFWMEPLFPTRTGENQTIIPQMYMYQQHDWRPTTVTEDDSTQTAASTPSLSSESASPLPDGIREFIRQVEHLYDQDDDVAMKTQREILESLASSEHMPICFPHLVKFAVDKIRITYRKDGDVVMKLLELLEHILRNQHFDLTDRASSDIFDLLVGCFVMLSTDVNLLSIEGQSGDVGRIRQSAAVMLRGLLESKIGKFHAVELIEDLIDSHLVPLITVTRTSLKNRNMDPNIRNRLEGVLTSTVNLMKELMHVNEPRLATRDRLSYIG